ncbi:hypothetical protein COV17_00955 [Candidatus Woesearchaeota archaeon CG10_big_fil_rev_8_21_14_0_10_36_11]|nr:MAG: hypothetical protein COV17_00955 [Candidatus Woesearchaeota archaeon CG10_big_fil_rev_8_21_14_0_10_36_11]
MYNLELEKVIAKIKETNAKTVCVQLPDGMKPHANIVEETISKETGARVFIWLGSNFGACDVPLGLNRLHIDLLISWGHNKFQKEEGW